MPNMPQNRHGLIPMLVAIRVAAERKRRKAEGEVESEGDGWAGEEDKVPAAEKPKKKKRGWFG